MIPEVYALLDAGARAKVDTGLPLFVEDIIGVHIKTEMPPVVQAQIQVMRAMALVATVDDTRTRLFE